MDTASTKPNGKTAVAQCNGDTAGMLYKIAITKKYTFENSLNCYKRASGKNETNVYLLVLM